MRVVSGTSRGSLRGGNTASSSAPSSGVSVDMPPTSSGVAPVFASDSDTRSDSEDVVEQSINSRRAQETPAVSLGPAPSSGPAASPGPSSPSGGGFTRLSLKKVLISYVITILN
ncbi:hypothetical protein HMPREF1544_01690 [Mucor circinelloides 1006PhL]|uniref:Uncharacterized protein n=1 Tax=Mucor circinelloides f. circinelloides (strain 1006PhL) TaxID=1220926 RepID=S2JN30_MUCC1|nr:hypothetical protein HMPREF1544_01690 [Mucor circinelloides 1006PhL]